jgi:hypothetical protein
MIAAYEDHRIEERRRIALVVDEPDNDRRRFELAAWLDRVGRDPARAEFIRVDIQYRRRILACFHSAAADGSVMEINALRERRNFLWESNIGRWSAPLLGILDLSGDEVSFSSSRGLIGGIRAASSKLAQRVVERCDDLLKLAPIEKLCLWGDWESGIAFAGVLGCRTIKALIRTRMFWGLKSLDLTGNRIGDSGAAILTRAVPPPRLKFVTLRSNNISYCMEQRLRERYRGCFFQF